MAIIQNFLRRFQLQYRRSSSLTKVVVSTAIALCTVALVALRLTQWESREKLALLQEQAAILEQENADLNNRIENLGSMDSMRQIAQEELGLVDPDTIIFEQSE